MERETIYYRRYCYVEAGDQARDAKTANARDRAQRVARLASPQRFGMFRSIPSFLWDQFTWEVDGEPEDWQYCKIGEVGCNSSSSSNDIIIDEYVLRPVSDRIEYELSVAQIHKLVTWLNSAEAYRWLPNTMMWGQGGCWLLAEALHRLLADSRLVTVKNKDNRTEHVVVEYPVGTDRYLDADGWRDENALLRYWEENDVVDPWLDRFDADEGEAWGLECPFDKIEELTQLLRDVVEGSP